MTKLQSIPNLHCANYLVNVVELDKIIVFFNFQLYTETTVITTRHFTKLSVSYRRIVCQFASWRWEW